MILLFGGTTEGRKAAEVLEDAGTAFFYSTKTGEQSVNLHHGTAVAGAMTHETMVRFCHDHSIKLIIDAAHPFASHLHDTVAAVARSLGLPAIRYERIFPQAYDPRIVWCDGYDDFISKIKPLGHITVLATTGVQSIGRLRCETDAKIIFRILRRDSSVALAREQGASDSELCFYNDESEASLLERLKPDILLAKDSGLTGGFCEKVEEALRRGIDVYVLRRPPTPSIFHRVNGPHGLRRMVERLLPEFYPLHSGLTTGTCATASALAAATILLRGEKPASVDVILPNGETIPMDVAYGDGYAYTIKDAGDDPDVTDGLEIRAAVAYGGKEAVNIVGGDGVGRLTLPGFDYPIGEAAINRVPREMIRRNIVEKFSPHQPLTVTVSVPDGERVAQRTFNPRLGIVGGISIVGVSGIVKPFSEESFVASIRKCVEVAKASGSDRVVINSGAKSERFVRRLYPALPSQAFVEYGNYIGETIHMAAELGFKQVTLGIMMGKAVKLAAGNLDTHSRKTIMDKAFIASILRECGCAADIVARSETMTLARELWTVVPKEKISDFAATVIAHCHRHCAQLLPDGSLTILLIDEQGGIYGA